MKSNIDLDFFEYIILDNCFKNEAYLASIVGFAKPQYFGGPDNRKIYALLKGFYDKRGRLPTNDELKVYMNHDSLKLAFKNVQATLNQLKTYGEDELIENTEIFLKERGFALLLEEVVTNYNNLDLKNESGKILEEFDRVCSVSLNTELGLDFFNDIEKFTDSLDREEEYITTGFSWLDKKLGGGYRKSGRALYIFSGTTNSGKSIMLGNTASTGVKEGLNVVVISLEMSEEVYATRSSAQLSRIPMRELKNEKETLIKFCKDFRKNNGNTLIIKEFPNNTIKVSAIRNYLNELKKRKRFKPDLIIIDYLNLLVANNPTGQTYTDIKSVTEEIRALSYLYNCPVISATQLGRDAINQENPGIETTSESIGTAQTADVQIAVYSSEDDRSNGMINIGIQKNRYGDNFGTKTLSIDWDTLHVEQFADDEEDDEGSIENFINDAESSLRSLEIM